MDSPCVSVWLGEALAAYGFGEGHPFGPDRMEAFRKRLYAMGLHRQVRLRVPERGGGYNRDNLARAWTAVVAALLGETP